MKKIAMCVLCGMLTGVTVAQQRSADQWIGKASGGANLSSKGYFIEVGAEKIIGNSSGSIQLSFLYNNQAFTIGTEENITVRDYFGTVYYTYTFLTNSPLRFSLLCGGFLGFQEVPEIATEGVVSNAESKFSYGFSLAAQAEFVVLRNLSLYIQPTILYNIPSDVEKFTFLGGAGVKIYF